MTTPDADATPARIVLLGMMGAGKSTVGHELSVRTGWPYVDNDALLASAAGEPTEQAADTLGADGLHRLEARALVGALARPGPYVLGAAASTVEDPRAREAMRPAYVVYLRARVPTLAARVGSGAGRPWLDGDPVPVLTALLDRRGQGYEQLADVVVDVDERSPAEVAGVVLEALRELRH